MSAFLAHPLVRVGLLLLAIAVLAAVGALMSRFRDRAEEDQLGASELLSNFRELHEEGELSEQEFRKIKTLLAAKLEQELKDNGKQD